MKKFFIKITIALIMVFMPAITVFASENENTYTNAAGVTMSLEEYNFIKEHLGETFAKCADETWIKMALEDINNVKIIKPNKPTIMPINTWKLDDLTYDVSVFGGINGYYVFFIDATWNKIPNIKSFDVLAWRWSLPNVVIDEYTAYQWSDAGEVYYTQNGTNTNHTSYGIGTSMNIINGTSSYLDLTLRLNVHFTSTALNSICGTYQHAETDVTLEQSKDYTFSSSGLGYVLNYPSSVRSHYSNYEGACFTFTPDLP